jgi:hypothetical protein
VVALDLEMSEWMERDELSNLKIFGERGYEVLRKKETRGDALVLQKSMVFNKCLIKHVVTSSPLKSIKQLSTA